MRKLFVLIILAPLMWASAGAAQELRLEGEQEDRARALFSELRCVVCQNQSIDGSDADVAADLRQIVREQIRDGKSDGEIVDFLVQRYGEFVLLKPRFAPHTLLLWIAPLALLLLGGMAIFFATRSKRDERGSEELSSEEQARLADILREGARET